MKINEVDKAMTLAPVECITAIAADGSLIQIPVSELGKVMARIMPVATNNVNGLMSSGFMKYLTMGETYDRFVIIKYINIGTYVTLFKTGHYGKPSFYSINVGISGGSSHIPVSLQVKLISGPSIISDAKVYVRDKKDYIELTFNSSISWCSHSAMDIGSNLDSISMNASDRYNLDTDSNLIVGTVIE